MRITSTATHIYLLERKTERSVCFCTNTIGARFGVGVLDVIWVGFGWLLFLVKDVMLAGVSLIFVFIIFCG